MISRGGVRTVLQGRSSLTVFGAASTTLSLSSPSAAGPLSTTTTARCVTSISDFNLPRIGFSPEFTLGRHGAHQRTPYGEVEENYQVVASAEHLQDPMTLTSGKKWDLGKSYCRLASQNADGALNSFNETSVEKYANITIPPALPPSKVLATLNLIREGWNEEHSTEQARPLELVRTACVVSLAVQEIEEFYHFERGSEEEAKFEAAKVEAAKSEEGDSEEGDSEEGEESEDNNNDEEEESSSKKTKSIKTKEHYERVTFYDDGLDFKSLLNTHFNKNDETFAELRGRLGLLDRDEVAVAEALASENEQEEFRKMYVGLTSEPRSEATIIIASSLRSSLGRSACCYRFYS